MENTTISPPIGNYWILAILLGLLYPTIHVIAEASIGTILMESLFGYDITYAIQNNDIFKEHAEEYTGTLFIFLPILIMAWGFKAKKLPSDLTLRFIYRQYLIPTLIITIVFMTFSGRSLWGSWLDPFLLLTIASILSIMTPKGIKNTLLIVATICVIEAVIGYVAISFQPDATLTIFRSLLSELPVIPEYLFFIAVFNRYVGNFYKLETPTENYWLTIKASLDADTKIISIDNK